MSAHQHFNHQRLESNTMYLPHIVPPPPYSTLPSRNQRRLHIEAQPTPQSSISTSPPSGHQQSTTSSPGTPNVGSTEANNLPSYHHLYSSSSPSSLRRRRRRLRQRRRESHLSENKKYLIFISLVLIIGILLTLVGVITLSLFTVSFGFTFILFSLLLYKLLPSSKYAVNAMSPGLSAHHTHPYIISDPSISHAFPAPPPSYQEATQVNSTQLVQLAPSSFINRVTAACTGNASSSCPSNQRTTMSNSSNCNSNTISTNNGNCTSVVTTSGASNSRLVTDQTSSANNRLHFVTIIEATI